MSFRTGELHIDGGSWAGDATWFRVHPSGIAFDVGRGVLQLAGSRELFVSHGHLDHSLGVPYVLSQRTLHQEASTRVFCPREMASDLVDLVEAAARLEAVEYDYRVVALQAGDRVELSRDLVVEAFATDHVVPSLGYHLVRRKRRLAPDLRDLPERELVDRKRQGEEIEVVEESRWLSYCGDTGPGVLDRESSLYGSDVLLLECTFLDPTMRERAGRYGHIHLDDLVERQDEFRNRAIVLHHLSRRHRVDDLQRLVAERLPRIADRVHLLMGPR